MPIQRLILVAEIEAYDDRDADRILDRFRDRAESIVIDGARVLLTRASFDDLDGLRPARGPAPFAVLAPLPRRGD